MGAVTGTVTDVRFEAGGTVDEPVWAWARATGHTVRRVQRPVIGAVRWTIRRTGRHRGKGEPRWSGGGAIEGVALEVTPAGHVRLRPITRGTAGKPAGLAGHWVDVPVTALRALADHIDDIEAGVTLAALADLGGRS